MAGPAWIYSDWITFETGSASRLSRLRLHIKEVSDFISTGSMTSEKKAHDVGPVEDYLKTVLSQEKVEAAAAGAINGTRAYWTKAKANL